MTITRSSSRAPWEIIALGGGLTAAFTGAILLIDAYRHRNPGYSCTDVQPDTQALSIDITVVDGITGSYELWPFGLTCEFPRIGGGMLTVGPDASLSVVALCFLAASVIAVAALVAVGIGQARRRRSS